MAECRIDLGAADRVALLFSYPNSPAPHSEKLEDTVLHWFGKTMEKDGVVAHLSVEITDGMEVVMVLDGDDSLASTFDTYALRFPAFLENGWAALQTAVPKIVAAGKWDPSPDEPLSSYRPWRFFLPLGMAMANQRCVQFFHYPPIRLLEGTRDYLSDPVPARVFELLQANGVSDCELSLYSTVMDGAPIAAADDQGSKKLANDGKTPVGDPVWGLIPINYFPDYQRSQVALLLNDSPSRPGYTVPIIVYGAHPRQIFEGLYGVRIGRDVPGQWQFIPEAVMAEIVPGKQTPVVGSNHPYNFYAEAQGFPTVGSGKYLSAAKCANATVILQGDLAIARWQKMMFDEPAQDPQSLLEHCIAYWADPAQAAAVCALARHQASLTYDSPDSLAFRFATSLGEAALACGAHSFNPCAGITP